MASLVLEDVIKSFGGVTVIHGVELAVDDGEFVVFVGPSGCGKSTLLRMIAGLETTTSGDIVIDGERVNDTGAAERGLAMVFQNYALYPHMSVYENLAFGLQNTRLPKAEIAARVDHAARLLQIDALMKRKPGQLSGGQRQRVAIGRAITRNPRIFLFDEPLSNLDAELRVQMRLELSKLHQDLRSTMIYVTHDQVEAMTMADKIVVLRAGRIEQVGRPLDLYNRPANRFVAGFIGSPKMNFVAARLVGIGDSGVTVRVDGLPDLALPRGAAGVGEGEPVTVGIRPEHFSIGAANNEAGGNEAGGWPFEIASIEQLGGLSYIHGALADGTKISVTCTGQSDLKGGDRLTLTARPHDIHLFQTGAGDRAIGFEARRDNGTA